MNYSELKKIHQRAQEESNYTEGHINFGNTFKGMKFDKVIHNGRFQSWMNYMLEIEDEWTHIQQKDMSHLRAYIDDLCEKNGIEGLDIIDQVDKLIDLELQKEEPTFKSGRYKGKHMKDVPKEFKVWFVNKTFHEHPLSDEDYWNSSKGRYTSRLLKACDI
jgi:hypothetical protein